MPKQTLMTTAQSFRCNPCGMRLTVISGEIDSCPDCGGKIVPEGNAKIVEIVR